MLDLIRVLEKIVSPSQADQSEALKFIQDYTARDFVGFLKALSDVLFDQKNPPVARAAAGLQLKNQLTARDDALRTQQQERWRSLPEETRLYIKERVFRALGTEVFRPSSAPQCLAYIAIVELPNRAWPGLIEALTQNVTNPASTPQLRLASLEAIGYICQDIDQSCLQPGDSNHILTALVVTGMQDVDIEIKLAATNALLNSLEFTESNFQREEDRNHIMGAIFEVAKTCDTRIQVAALQCLVKIMSLYYHHMEKYIEHLFGITTQAMNSKNDDIALQGIEFWSNVCDEEIQLISEAAEAQELGQQPERESKQYAARALQFLVPILVELLATQDESDDSEDWKPCKSAGVCLMLLANCCENAVVGHVLPYIEQNVQSEDWRRRDAAIMTFGSILDGPDQSTLQPIAVRVVPFLIRFMRDSSVVVRDSAAWAIGKLCDTVPDAVLSLPLETGFLQNLVQGLAENLDSEPRVASNVCWAINSLVTAAGDSARERLPQDVHPETFLLSSYYQGIIQGLLKTTDRQDRQDQEHNLRSAAYEALMAVIKAAPTDCYSYVYPTTFNMILQRISSLNDTIQRPEMRAPEIRGHLHDFLSLLWTTLASCIRRMDRIHSTNESDRIMGALLITLQNSLDSGATQEDALMAASSLLEAIGEKFSAYMPHFRDYLVKGISSSAVPQLNLTAIGLLSDLSRILGEGLLLYSHDIMQALLAKLMEESYDKNAKAQILSVFGDFALAFGRKFETWIPTCLDMLHQASLIQPADRNDYDLVDYCIKLRECAIEGYTGIIQGMRAPDYLLHRVPVIIQFLELVANDPDMTDGLLCSCCGLVGDIVESFGSSVTHLVNSENIKNLIAKGKRSRSEKTQKIAIWAQNVIRKYRVTRT